jgi:cytochrome P450
MTTKESSGVTGVCPVTFVDGVGGVDAAKPVIGLDLHAPEFAKHNYEIYDELRASCPVAWSTEGDGFWFLTSYGPVYDATKDDYAFISSAGAGVDKRPEGSGDTMAIPIETDPPDTVPYRKITIGKFSPKNAAALEPEIRRMANELIDEFIESGEGDLVKQLSTPLPARTIMRMLGMDESRWPDWVSWIHTFVHGQGPAKMQAMQQLMVEITTEIHTRGQAGEPGDDLLSAIMTGRIHDRPMSESEQLRYVLLMLLGGMDTTSGLTGNSLERIAADPELRRKLVERRDLLRSATEEFLRHGTPTQGLGRTVSEDVEFYGQQLKAGDRVMLMWAAANRDPAEFPDPGTIDIERHPNRHMAFGVGLHRCLGSNLARTMFQVMIDEILNRLPDFELTVDEVPRFDNAANVYAPTAFPVRFTPGPRMYPPPSD